ncbi:MAG: tRNA pseudouridine(13) synthase TruD [Planctomycetota bacterium]
MSPRPQRYLTDQEGIGGVIKARPEDFLVEELSLYEPSGEGEHLYLQIEKTAVSHGELISRLRRRFGVREDAIGFAGMKDKIAVTRQTVSIHLREDPPDVELDHDRIRVLWASRHTNKIRIGHLAGNRFSIRIREVDPVKVTVVKPVLDRLARIGVPGYFGGQRFGYRHNNHLVGLALLKEDWSGLLAELLGATGSPFPEYQRARRELFDGGRFQDAAAMWTPADRNELTAINVLCLGKSEREACAAVGKSTRSFWISALQSAVFNRVLDQRIADGTLTTLVEGDLAWKHDSGSVFLVTADELASGRLCPRLEALEISPSGPLWGAGMIRPQAAVAEAEQQALAGVGVPLDTFADTESRLQGARRPLRVPMIHPETEAGADEHGPYIRVAFDLTRGAYATVLLREIMKTPELPDFSGR